MATATSSTYADIAANLDLWREHVDTSMAFSDEEFDAMSHADRMAHIIETFGPEPERAPTVEQVLMRTAIGNGLHSWDVEGGSIQIGIEQLRPLLEAAFDPSMENWIALVDVVDLADF